MEEIKEVQTIRKKMEKNIVLEFKREVMESIETERVIANEKWTKKIKGTLMDDYELEVDEFIKNFKYTGGDGRRYGTHNDHVKDMKANRHLNYWNMTRNYEIHPPHKEYCICRTPIMENCYAVDKRDKEKLVCLGNCCIERFLGDSAKRTCERCDEPHRNRKDNFCKECRIQNKEDEKKRMEEEKLKRIEEEQKKGMEEYKKRMEEEKLKRIEDEKKRMEDVNLKKIIEYREKFREIRKQNERVWTNEEIQEILIKIYENSKIRCCAEKYEDEEKINDDFKICGKNGCEKLIKKCYKYCYLCYKK
jgi:hypothetical protein